MPRPLPKPGKSEYGDRAWRELSRKVRAKAGWKCEVCGAPATSTDHIVPVAEAPHLRLVETNLRATCAKHNQGRVQARLSRMAHLNRSIPEVREW